MINKDICQALQQLIPNEKIKVDELLKRYTYTRTGGSADFYVTPTRNVEVQAVVKYAYQNEIPVTYLGSGSSIIIREGGIRGIVISLLSLGHTEVSDDAIMTGGGATIIGISRIARDHALTGLGFVYDIPGSIGGAVYMNAGAYGGEVKDCIDYVLCVSKQGSLVKLITKELELDYHNSIIQKEHLVVLEATFTLAPGRMTEIQAKMDDLTERRESKQSLEYPSCGSVFQRPPGHFAGKLIQGSNLQGHRIGSVEASTKHAGFTVNVDNGIATDYENLIHCVQKIVKEKFDIELNRKVRIVDKHPRES